MSEAWRADVPRTIRSSVSRFRIAADIQVLRERNRAFSDLVLKIKLQQPLARGAQSNYFQTWTSSPNTCIQSDARRFCFPELARSPQAIQGCNRPKQITSDHRVAGSSPAGWRTSRGRRSANRMSIGKSRWKNCVSSFGSLHQKEKIVR